MREGQRRRKFWVRRFDFIPKNPHRLKAAECRAECAADINISRTLSAIKQPRFEQCALRGNQCEGARAIDETDHVREFGLNRKVNDLKTESRSAGCRFEGGDFRSREWCHRKFAGECIAERFGGEPGCAGDDDAAV